MSEPEEPTGPAGSDAGGAGAGGAGGEVSEVSEVSEGGDTWVSGTGWTPRRVPGIHEVPDTTYVDQPNRVPRRTLIIGGAVVLASIAIGLGLVLAANSDDGASKDGAELSAAATLTTPSSRATTTTNASSSTTTPGGSGSGGSSGTTATTKPTVVAATTPKATTPAAPPATPRATANPASAPYQPVPIPTGVSATLSGCSWSGGQLQSSGTITSRASGTRVWTVTTHWVQNSRELAQSHLLIALNAGEAKPWTLNLGAPNPPADLSCFLEIS